MKFLCKIFGHRWEYETGVMVDSHGKQYSWTDWLLEGGVTSGMSKVIEKRHCCRCGVKEEHEIHQFSVEG